LVFFGHSSSWIPALPLSPKVPQLDGISAWITLAWLFFILLVALMVHADDGTQIGHTIICAGYMKAELQDGRV
jgi:hypothetical protein